MLFYRRSSGTQPGDGTYHKSAGKLLQAPCAWIRCTDRTDLDEKQPEFTGKDPELRSPDAASNPYLVFAVCLAAGLDGIQKKIYPTKASDRSLSESDQKEQGIENLPENLREAITLFEESDWMKEILGEDFCKQYAQAKRKEWLRYSQEISDWEIEEYLYRI